MGPILEKRLLKYLGGPKEIYHANKKELMSVVGVGEALAENIISSRSLDRAYSILEECEKKHIKLMTYYDPLYPSIAKEDTKAPILLYYRGIIREEIEGVGIVGSRKCSSYGKRVTIEAAQYLAQENIPVISGMAKGIDGYAHIACLKAGGYTLAFLGNSVDICYPKEHRELMEGIIENGAVISEYPPNTKPRAEFFPRRNRFISSWSRKVLIAEAAQRSGALITADLAKSQGKEVYVPPHEIYTSTGKGSNQLILRGANLYLNPSQLKIKDVDISSEIKSFTESTTPNLKVPKDTIEKKQDKLLPMGEKILSCISHTPKSIEEIANQLHMSQIDLIEYISTMEIEGIIKTLAGGLYGAN